MDILEPSIMAVVGWGMGVTTAVDIGVTAIVNVAVAVMGMAADPAGHEPTRSRCAACAESAERPMVIVWALSGLPGGRWQIVIMALLEKASVPVGVLVPVICVAVVGTLLSVATMAAVSATVAVTAGVIVGIAVNVTGIVGVRIGVTVTPGVIVMTTATMDVGTHDPTASSCSK